MSTKRRVLFVIFLIVAAVLLVSVIVAMFNVITPNTFNEIHQEIVPFTDPICL